MSEIVAPVLAEGLWLGTANRIATMRYLKTWGWVAQDVTGVEYAQRAPRYGNPMRVVTPKGLRAASEPWGVAGAPVVPWPPAPHFDRTDQPEGDT